MLRIFTMAAGIASTLLSAPALADAAPATTEQYRQQAEAELEARKSAAERPARARNVIIFIGDGMGVSTLTAARIRAGEAAGEDGESFVTAMDRLDHTALVKTYSHDGQVSDSAPTATAIMAGVKTRNSAIGVGPEIKVNDCASALAHPVPSLLGIAQKSGLATGVVTTTGITHATPAAAYAHTPQRNWESDADMPAEALAQGCRDIARQLVEGPVGSQLDVILGGGRSFFLPARTASARTGVTSLLNGARRIRAACLRGMRASSRLTTQTAAPGCSVCLSRVTCSSKRTDWRTALVSLRWRRWWNSR